MKQVAYTEYAVEVHNNHGFVRQIDVFPTYEEAEEFINSYSEPLDNGEYLNIIFIDIDVNHTEDFNRDYDCLTKCKEALEKQIPMKPKELNVLADVIAIGRCPICGESCSSDMKYCFRCGQSLDWSKE